MAFKPFAGIFPMVADAGRVHVPWPSPDESPDFLRAVGQQEVFDLESEILLIAHVGNAPVNVVQPVGVEGTADVG